VYRTSLQVQIDDYINSTIIKQLGGNIALGCFDYFFPPKFNNDNNTFQLNRFKEND